MSQGHVTEEKSSGMAIASMVLGILSLIMLCIPYVGIPCAIIGIVLGIVARGNVKQGTGSGGGMAMAGIVCGAIALVLCIVVIAGVFALFNSGVMEEFEEGMQEMQREMQQEMERQQIPVEGDQPAVIPEVPVVPAEE